MTKYTNFFFFPAFYTGLIEYQVYTSCTQALPSCIQVYIVQSILFRGLPHGERHCRNLSTNWTAGERGGVGAAVRLTLSFVALYIPFARTRAKEQFYAAATSFAFSQWSFASAGTSGTRRWLPRSTNRVTRLDYAQTGASVGEAAVKEAANENSPPNLGESLASARSRVGARCKTERVSKRTRYRRITRIFHVCVYFFIYRYRCVYLCI